MATRKSVLALLAFMALAADAQPVPQAPTAGGDRLEVETGTVVPSEPYNAAIGGKAAQYCERQACDTPPTVLRAVAPTYPPAALLAEIEGRAVVVFDLDATGTPINVTLESATAPEFGQAGIDAISFWRFKPAVLAGKAIQYRGLRQSFPFELRD